MMHPLGLRCLTWLPDDSFLVVGQDQHASQSVLHHLTAAPHVTGAEEEHLNLRYKRLQLWVRSESALGLRRNSLVHPGGCWGTGLGGFGCLPAGEQNSS